MPFVAYRRRAGERPPLIVVDLGFSSSKATCGLKAPDGAAENRSFGPMVKEVRKLLRARPTAVLVLEAPLCAKYKTNGNPDRRGGFEGGEEEEAARGWYHGTGPAVALAALRLLKLLQEDPQLCAGDILLAEAFLTRAVLPNAHHDKVAQLIYDRFHQVAPIWIDGGVPLHPALPEAPGVWVFTAENLGLGQ